VPDDPVTNILMPWEEGIGVPIGSSPRELKVMTFWDPEGAAGLTGKVIVLVEVME